jgi:predicted metal-binding protein
MDREAFEAWEKSEGLPVDRFPEDDRFSWPAPGRYKHKMVDAHWAAWQAAIKAERERASKPRDAFAEAEALTPQPCESCDGTMVGDSNGYNAFLRCQKCNMVPTPWSAAAIRARSTA